MIIQPSESLDSIYQSCVNLSMTKTPTELRQNIGYKLDVFWRNIKNKNTVIEIDNLFSSDYVNTILPLNTRGDVILNKQQPSLVEAVHETSKRLQFMENMVEDLPDCIQGVIVGGSLSYGRFVNIRSSYPDSSDLDLIVVTNGIQSKQTVDNLLPVSLGFKSSDQKQLLKRLNNFNSLKKRGLVDMVSHKFALPVNGFDVSMHFMDEDVFTKMCHPSETGVDPISILDYKVSPFPHTMMRQKDVSGREDVFQISEQKIELGVITRLPVYRLNETFTPGIYHNLISPMFEMYFGNQMIQNNIEDFRLFLSEATKKVNHNIPDITLSHPRRPLFSSYIINEINEKI